MTNCPGCDSRCNYDQRCPPYEERRDMARGLLNDSNISLATKMWLVEEFEFGGIIGKHLASIYLAARKEYNRLYRVLNPEWMWSE